MARTICATGVAAAIVLTTLHAAPPRRDPAQSLQTTSRQDKSLIPSSVIVTDSNTGLQIHQSTDAKGILTVEVQDQRVSIRKRNLPTGAEVTLHGAHGTVVIALNEAGLTMTGISGIQHLDSLDEVAYQRAQSLFARSTTVQDARALLDHLALRPMTMVGSSLLLTKVLLGTLAGDAKAVESYHAAIAGQLASRSNASRSSAPRLIRASLQEASKGGPGACWDQYEDYLMQIWSDFWDCVGHNWNSWLYYACEAKWLLQAELAMSWVIACSGGLPVH